MLISLNWLKDFVQIKESSPQIIADNFTLRTAEVEGFRDQAQNLDKVVVGQIKELKPHPNADKLKIAMTNIGKEILQIVCGGTNLYEGMFAPVALPGAQVDWHGSGQKMKIEKVKLRGVDSTGMLATAQELSLPSSDGPTEIMDLSKIEIKTLTPGTPLAEVLQKNDIIFEFDNKTLTHRPDLWSHEGLARELAAITGEKFKALSPSVKIPEKGESIKVEIEDFTLCPRYCGLIIENIKVERSPQWLIDRLTATGHGAHNNIVDITNYVMTELGQPMHAFDHSYIKTGITVRKAHKNEKFIALDGKEYTLDETNLVIADKEKPVAIAGIIGGLESGVNENTTKIILEAATFSAAPVRRTSTKIGVRTDSLQRFEKSLDPFLPKRAIERAAELILQVCPGARIAGPLTDIKKFKETPLTTELSIPRAQKKIGIDIPKEDMIRILESLEFKVKQTSKDRLSVIIPSFRATKDIEIEDDLIEEIARLYGYDKIPARLPSLPIKHPEENTERLFKHRIRNILSTGLGFDEIINYSFYGPHDLEKCLMPDKAHLKLLNFISEEMTHLRTTLVPNVLKAIELNAKNFDEFSLYEIGRTYKEVNELFPREEKRVCAAKIRKGNLSDTFYELKGALETLFSRFKIKKLKPVKEIKNAPFAHPYKALSYLDNNGETIAKLFMLHPQVRANYNLEKFEIALFEFNLTRFMELPREKTFFTPLPRFPKIEIDVSVLIEKTMEITTIMEAIEKADTTLISDIKLFDIYEGKSIPENLKAVAFRITLQAEDRTLTDNEMAQIQSLIFKNLESLGGKIRGK